MQSTVAHSGSNPEGPYQVFIKNDTIQNIDVRRDEKPPVDIATDYAFMKNRIPYGATTFTYKSGKLDKNYSLDRTNIEQKELPRNATDHVSYDPPGSTRPQQKVYDLMMTKPRYAKNHESTVHWVPYDQRSGYSSAKQRKSTVQVPRSSASNVPKTSGTQLPPDSRSSQLPPASQRSNSSIPGMYSKTMNNRSSVQHNIISGGANLYSKEMKPKLLDVSVFNIKKGVTEIRNLSGPNSINRNPDHVRAIGESD